jgi:Tfp pilus assembly protein PilO
MEMPNLDKKFFTQYKELIIAGGVIILAALLGCKLIFDNFATMQKSLQERKAQALKLKDAQKKLKDYESVNKQLREKQKNMKRVFNPKSSIEDSITAFGGMFEDIIDYVKSNNLMLRSVEYNLNPPEDVFYSKYPTLYNVCNVHLMMVGTYVNLQGFMRDMMVYPYFTNISEIRINQYEKDETYIIINMNITLYSKKQQSAASVLDSDDTN